MNKKTYATPVLLIHGDVEKLTCGSRILFSDAWFGDASDGNDGEWGPKCKPDSDFLACTSDGSG